MKQSTIDMIMSILITKGFVRCGYDRFEKDDFDYIEKNFDKLVTKYNKLSLSSIELYIPVDITLYRINYTISSQPLNIEVMHNPIDNNYQFNYQKANFQTFDILVNTKIINTERAKIIFGINK